MLALVVSAAGDLGRLALAAHRERILAGSGAERTRRGGRSPRRASGDGGDRRPAGGRAGRFQLRRWPGRPDPVRAPAVLEELAGRLSLRAAWRVGGIEDSEGSLVHRRDLAAAGEGEGCGLGW